MLIDLFVQLKVCLQSVKSTEMLFGQSDNNLCSCMQRSSEFSWWKFNVWVYFRIECEQFSYEKLHWYEGNLDKV